MIVENCAIATVDAHGTEHANGHIVIADGRITAVGEGRAPQAEGDRIDAAGCLATPGLVNCHHHLYQWLTRGLAQQSTLFEWLQELYPVWAKVDDAALHAATRAGLAALARSGCTTSTDHHYVFPQHARDLLGTEIEAAQSIGLRFHPCRGSMDLGRSQGGLPPDAVVEDRDAILAASEDAIARFHDPAPDSHLRIALAPCSPFSVTRELMAETATLARRHGVRLHTHLAETDDEEAFCLERFGVRPVDYLAELGWLGDDVWLAHCIHLNGRRSRASARPAPASRTARPRTRGSAPASPRASPHRAWRAVGLGVDGAASNEAGELAGELRQALYLARLAHGPKALTAREALALGTIHGARCLGREDELGSLEPGKLADVALWRLDDLDHAGIADPVAALVFGPRPIVDTLIVNGRTVVDQGHLTTADEATIARELDEAVA